MQRDPNDLIVFARVVKEGSFSWAAARLNVPQSTLSQRITARTRVLLDAMAQEGGG